MGATVSLFDFLTFPEFSRKKMATQTLPMPALAPSPSPIGITVTSRPKAVCPDATLKAGDHIVRAVSGSGRDSDGRDFYVYNCACGRFWKQIRASQLRDGEIPDILPASNNTVTGSNTRKRGQTGTGYLCSRCHQPKKNHVCSAEKRPKQSLFHVPDTHGKPQTVTDPIQVPVWFMELDENPRSDILTFVWGIEHAGIEWTQEILFQMMSRHNLTPNQAADVIKLFCNGKPTDKHPLCTLCGFPALDDDSKLIACTACAKKHCHVLCGADAGWMCDACVPPATPTDATGA
jgi:hypothetical protein